MLWVAKGTGIFAHLLAILAEATSSGISGPVTSEAKFSGIRMPLIITNSISAGIGQASVRVPCPPVRVMGEESNVIWILDGVHFVVSANTSDNKKYAYLEPGGQLEIRNVSRKDAGIYRCIAHNKWTGKYDTAAVELVVGSPPRPSTILGQRQRYQTPEGKGRVTPRNSIGQAITAGIAAFIFFSLSCILYHYRWKPVDNSSLEQTGSPKYKPNLMLPSSTSSPPLCSAPPLPRPKSRIYLLPSSSSSSNNNSDNTSILRPPPTNPIFFSTIPPTTPTTTTAPPPPLITTNVELTTISGKRLATRRDGGERTIFLQPPSSIPSVSPHMNKNLPFLYPPASAAPAPPAQQKMYLATPESSSSSLSLVVEEECGGGGSGGGGDLLTLTATSPPFLI